MDLFGMPVVHGSESMFSEPLFHCITITCFPLGTIEFQLKKASEGLSFLSSFLLLVIDFNNCYETEKKMCLSSLQVVTLLSPFLPITELVSPVCLFFLSEKSLLCHLA